MIYDVNSFLCVFGKGLNDMKFEVNFFYFWKCWYGSLFFEIRLKIELNLMNNDLKWIGFLRIVRRIEE